MQVDLSELCESFYRTFNSPEYIEPDPLQFVRRYPDPGDREVSAFIASSMALGRVQSILNVVARILDAIPRPVADLLSLSIGEIRERLDGCFYRFFRVEHLVGLLVALKRTLEEDGSLEHSFAVAADGVAAGTDEPWRPTLDGLSGLTDDLRRRADGALENTLLLADPRRGSSCKRLFLFLRWLVRSDVVDPGGWSTVLPSQLLVPLDVHMLGVARRLGLTRRTAASMRTAIEVTDGFRRIHAGDPVRYDFCLTRPGINPRLSWDHDTVRCAAGPMNPFTHRA